MAERAGDSEATARALGGLGDAEYLRGRMLTAGNYFRRSVDASVRAGLGRIEASNRPMAALATMFELRLADALQEALVAVERARLMTQPRAELIGKPRMRVHSRRARQRCGGAEARGREPSHHAGAGALALQITRTFF